MGQGLLVLTMPVVARMYGPAEFGLFATVLAWVGLAAPAAGGRFDAAIPAARSDREALALLNAAVGIAAWIGPLVGLAAGLVQLYDGTSVGRATAVAVAAGGLVFLGSLSFSLRYWHTRGGRYALLGRVALQQGAVRAVAPMVLGLVSGSWLALCVAEALGRVVGTRALVGPALRRRWRGVRRLPRRVYSRLFRQFREFPKVSVPSVLLDSAALSLPVPLTLYYYGPAAAGIVGLGMRLTLAPVALVGKAVADVYHAELGHATRRNDAAPGRLFILLSVGLLTTGLAGFVPLYLWVPKLVPVLLGAEWTSAVPVIEAFIPWGFAAYVVGPLTRSLLVLGGQHLKLVYDVGSLLGIALVMANSAAEGATAEVALARMAAINVGMYVVLYLMLILRHLFRGRS